MGLNVLKSFTCKGKSNRLTESEAGTLFSAGVWVAGTGVKDVAWVFSDMAVFFDGSIALVDGEDTYQQK